MTGAGAARVDLAAGETRVATGVVVLDHLLEEMAAAAGFGLQLEIAPDQPEAEVEGAGRALGEAVAAALGQEGIRRGFGIAPADEALAMVVLEASSRALVVSNVDLTSTRAGGLRIDLAATFLDELAEAARLTVHVRLLEGDNSQHVLSAIFKALGIALAQATKGDNS